MIFDIQHAPQKCFDLGNFLKKLVPTGQTTDIWKQLVLFCSQCYKKPLVHFLQNVLHVFPDLTIASHPNLGLLLTQRFIYPLLASHVQDMVFSETPFFPWRTKQSTPSIQVFWCTLVSQFLYWPITALGETQIRNEKHLCIDNFASSRSRSALVVIEKTQFLSAAFCLLAKELLIVHNIKFQLTVSNQIKVNFLNLDFLVAAWKFEKNVNVELSA